MGVIQSLDKPHSQGKGDVCQETNDVRGSLLTGKMPGLAFPFFPSDWEYVRAS